MKKFLLSIIIIISFTAYALFERRSNAMGPLTQSSPPTLSTTTEPSATSSQSTYPSANQAYKDGTYTGAVADAYYGNVQVQVRISSGKISSVQFLQYPQDRQNSVRINSQAVPLLSQEAIQAQSANVDIISGATATSEAFIQTLQSALRQA